jgi:hypothetical protein
MIMKTITLENKTYDIAQPTFGNLRKIISAFNEMKYAGAESISSSNESSIVIGLLIGKTPDEVDLMQISFKEMVDALAAVPEICGLEMKKVPSGEAPAVMETDLTLSTAI